MIKNKDGRPYQLQHPNKLGKSQKWDKVKLHNCQWKKEEVQGDTAVLPKIRKQLSGFVPKNKNIVVESTTTTTKPEIKQPEPKQEQELGHIVLFHCLLAKRVQYEDKLYGETISRIKYGKKIDFEGIITEVNDLEMHFWTVKPVEEESIVFPFRYKNNVPYDEYRWWRVVEVSEKNNGFLMRTVISQTQPDFSD